MTPVYDGRELPHQVGWFGGIYFRKIGPFAKGQVYEGHAHTANHITALISGRVRVVYRPRGGEVEKTAEFIAPINFEVRAEVWHEITALKDDTAWLCLFACKDTGEVP
jgi:quercetin dioxygenase-like cupin family protein